MAIHKSALALLAATASVVQAATPGCGKDPVASGTKSVNVNGQDRQYILKVPDNYDPNNPYRLIFGYHWLGGSMQNVAEGGYYGLEQLAAGNAIFVAPQGIDNGWGNPGGSDIAFTDQMLETVSNDLCINEGDIFALGWSYGGAMSYSLACSRPDVFRAVAVYSGAELSGCDGGNTPVPYLGIHGVVDSVLNVDMGRQLRDKFLGLNGCGQKDAPEPQPGSGSHIKTEYECSGAPVTWIAHSGDHVPDPQDNDGTYWAPGETWSFFEAAP
jgi:poly(3-hydroxybutyrate) depolymerase